MYYLIEDDPNLRKDTPEEVVDYCVDSSYWEDDYDAFDEYLNCDRSIEVCGYDFDPADVLKQMNEDAYDREFSNWIEDQMYEERNEALYEMNHNMRPGKSFYVCNYCVYCYEDDDEEAEGVVVDWNEISDALQAQLEQANQQEESERKRAESFESMFQTIRYE